MKVTVLAGHSLLLSVRYRPALLLCQAADLPLSKTVAELAGAAVRGAQHSFLALRLWRDPAESEANIAWGRSCYGVAEPFLEQGVYVNYLGDEGETRVRAAYGANYQRLAAIKQKYDPANFFRGNQNIQPMPPAQSA